ncbi:MAG TPA: transcriptional repressor [Geobacteraceae bacterium]
MKSQQKLLDEKIAAVERICREHKLPMTVQRRGVMEELAGRYDHPTADEVFESVRKRFPEISRATVYRVLDTFVTLGVVRKINSPEAKARFDADTRRHHHIHCICCGAIADVHAAGLDSLPIPDSERADFEIYDYSITFTGKCADCRVKDCARTEEP